MQTRGQREGKTRGRVCLGHREGKTEGQRDRGTMAMETERQRRRVRRPKHGPPETFQSLLTHRFM